MYIYNNVSWTTYSCLILVLWLRITSIFLSMQLQKRVLFRFYKSSTFQFILKRQNPKMPPWKVTCYGDLHGSVPGSSLDSIISHWIVWFLSIALLDWFPSIVIEYAYLQIKIINLYSSLKYQYTLEKKYKCSWTLFFMLLIEIKKLIVIGDILVYMHGLWISWIDTLLL